MIQGTAIVTENWGVRVSRAIMKSSDVRVEEIALRVWGRRVVRRRLAQSDLKRNKKRNSPYHTFLLFPLNLEQLSRHDNGL
jgi:hypothetical protein